MKHIMGLLLLSSCGLGHTTSKAGLFSQELYNYNFVRFENDEVICYKYGEADKGSISCKWKE